MYKMYVDVFKGMYVGDVDRNIEENVRGMQSRSALYHSYAFPLRALPIRATTHEEGVLV